MMKPIYEFQTIQVELTNACIHNCSNCTRFCGHHKKPFFMNWDTFKKAIDTLENWPRCVGIMGGEPTLHPEFERFVRYANEKHPMQYDIGGGHKPISSLSKYMIDANGIKTGPLNKFKGLGLWSSVCDKYYQHYELIQDSFIYQCINDHTASSRHQAWLMTRKEFGISDGDWIQMRDNCWWQRLLGSPSITPKGAFFCEVAAAMDILFDGPGGWKVEKGWWERGPEDYKDQLHWCELCSGAIHSFDRDANESVDDVSPVMYEKLRVIGSPKIKKPGALCVHTMGKDCDIEIKPRKNMLLYQPDHELRFTDKNKCLFPRRIFAITYISEKESIDLKTLEANEMLFDEMLIVTGDTEVWKALSSKFKVVKNDAYSDTVQLAMLIVKEKDWISIIEPTFKLDSKLRENMNKTIFNPGTFHIFEDSGMILFNSMAKAYRTTGFDGISALSGLDKLHTLWPIEKISFLNKGFENVIEPDFVEWNEKITNKGIMHWNYLKSVMNDIAVRRFVVPQIENILVLDVALAHKMTMLSNLELVEASNEMICNKIKTAIHNELGAAFANRDVSSIKEELLIAKDSFCAEYALALLSVGEEKERHLSDCILNERNIYHLGLSTLKIHYDAYNRKKPKYELQSKGIIEEIVETAKNKKPLVIVGNKYMGKSIEMILSKAQIKPVCFADDDRQGFDFDGIPTLSFQDAKKQYGNCEYLLSEVNEAADRYQIKLENIGFDKECLFLHPLTIIEMSMTPADENLDIALQQSEQTLDILRTQLKTILM